MWTIGKVKDCVNEFSISGTNFVGDVSDSMKNGEGNEVDVAGTFTFDSLCFSFGFWVVCDCIKFRRLEIFSSFSIVVFIHECTIPLPGIYEFHEEESVGDVCETSKDD